MSEGKARSFQMQNDVQSHDRSSERFCWEEWQCNWSCQCAKPVNTAQEAAFAVNTGSDGSSKAHRRPRKKRRKSSQDVVNIASGDSSDSLSNSNEEDCKPAAQSWTELE